MGTALLCLGSVEYNKLKKSATGADAEDEGVHSDE